MIHTLAKTKFSVSNLQAYYFTDKGVIKAVDHISFAVNERESIGIAGESACGKSTLGTAILRTMQPPGKVIEGSIILNRSEERRVGKECRSWWWEKYKRNRI